MQIVIPMAGRGDRFRRAGYQAIKPLIEVDGAPIIEHVLSMFPGESDFLFICARDHLETTPLRRVLQRLAPAGRIVAIEPHKLGPVHTLLAAAGEVRDDAPVTLNYCDFFAVWDWAAFKARMAAGGYAGAITAYRGFHPHSLGPNNYAYLREKDGLLLEIQEKKPYTGDKMNEYASAGTYYFRSGRLLKDAFGRAVAEGLSTNGEFYASTPYNLLVRDGLPVFIEELSRFCQWGTPEDLAEYQAWSHWFGRREGWRPALPLSSGANLIPMAGAGERFARAGYPDPKPLVPVAGVPMIGRALATLPPARKWVALCRSEHLADPRLLPALSGAGMRDVEVAPVDRLTEGQACTCLLGRGRVDPDQPLLIASCDAAFSYHAKGWEELTADPSVDCLVWTHRGHPHAVRNPKQYGWVRADGEGRALAVSCKVPLGGDVSRDPAVTGTFWFRRAGDFFAAADALIAQDRRVNGEFYADMAVQVAIERGARARLFDVEHFVCFGTPDDVRSFEYWESYFRERRGPARPLLSIVLPCYNEARTLPELLAAYRRAWEDLPAELVLVDNGSTDDTGAVLAALLARPEHAFARTVRVPVNRGYGHGIHTGLLAARGDYLAFSHADMQCPPADLFRAFAALLASPDPRNTLVKGSRRGWRGVLPTAITAGMSVLSSLVLGRVLTEINAQPKVFPRALLGRLTDPPDGFQYDLYVLYRARQAGMRLLSMPVTFGRRAHGVSRWAATLRSRLRTIRQSIAYVFRLRFAGAEGPGGKGS
jgi:NDP-sugar pyrophosphorylase family protein